MSEDSGSRDTGEVPVAAFDSSTRCPYGHTGWAFLRYGKEVVCGRCGVRIDAMPGREID